MSLMEKDISNMNAQIRRILSFEVSLSGNLSHVQNVIHDLNGIWFYYYVCLLSGCIVSLILELKSLFFIIVLPFYYLFVMLVCTEEKGQHSKRLRMKYFWLLTERSLTPYWQYFDYFLGRGGYFLYKITMNLYVQNICTCICKKKMYVLQQIFTETSLDSQHTLMDPFRTMGPSYYRMFTAI